MSEKVKFTLEYEVKSSPRILYSFISEPNGLSQWFADEVHYRDQVYSFVWDDGEEKQAKKVIGKENKQVRFAWLDGDEGYYFDMEISKDELTNDVALIITDFSRQENLKDRQLIWDNQIDTLLSVVGA